MTGELNGSAKVAPLKKPKPESNVQLRTIEHWLAQITTYITPERRAEPYWDNDVKGYEKLLRASEETIANFITIRQRSRAARGPTGALDIVTEMVKAGEWKVR